MSLNIFEPSRHLSSPHQVAGLLQCIGLCLAAQGPRTPEFLLWIKIRKYTNSGWCNKIDDITEIETVSISKLHNYHNYIYIRVGVFLCACEYITFYITDSMCTSCVDERVQKVLTRLILLTSVIVCIYTRFQAS